MRVYGAREHDGAHGAVADVRVTVEVLRTSTRTFLFLDALWVSGAISSLSPKLGESIGRAITRRGAART
jgi:hypothetical protein